MADELHEYEAQLKDSKFLHLLKPIRDLADNWNVDIANELDEYLHHLDRTGFSFDGGPSLDFAEAALLIQSSACVYSKKVEHLHNLVYQALEAARTRRKKDANGNEVEVDDDGAGGPTQRGAKNGKQRHQDEDDSLEAFLAAGDDLDECADIDLEDDADAQAPAYNRAPAALLALDDQQGQGGGSGADGDAGVYRLAQCYVHSSGALLLDYRDGERYDSRLRYTAAYCPAAGPQGAANPHPQQQQQGTQQLLQAPVLLKGSAEDDDDDDDGGGGGGGEDDDDEEGGDATMKDAAAAAAVAGGPTGAGAAPMAAAASAAAADGSGRVVPIAVAGGAQGVLPPGGIRREGGEEDKEEEEEGEEEFFDPYKPLDAHVPGNLPIKPMQVRKPGKARRGAAAFARQQQHNPYSLAPFLSAGPGSSSSTSVSNLVHQEFSYAAELMVSHRSGSGKAAAGAAGGGGTAAGRSAARAVGQNIAGGGAGAAFDWVDVATAAGAAAAGAAAEGGQRLDGGDDDDGNDDGGGGGDAGGWDDGGFGDDGDGGGGLDVSDVMAGMRGPHGTARALMLGGMGDDGGGDGNSYEDLCRSHIDAMIAAAAAKEVQTELSQRVSCWRTRIDPVLKEEEVRHTFDLQMYGDRILGRLQTSKDGEAAPSASASSPLNFLDVAGSAVRFEVSRAFAAMLQLINNRNVSIKQVGGPDAPFKLQLITAVQPHKHMAGKMAVGRGVAKGGSGEEGGSQREEGGGDQDNAGAAGHEEEEEGMAQAEEVEDGENVDSNIRRPAASSKAAAGKGKAAGGGGGKRPQAKRAKA